jgi:PHD/YefM family antitoxin component YafN of YafNO toxin-antitoxin module
MSIEIQNELANFHAFIGQLLQSKQAILSPEQALDSWRDEHPPLEEDPETVEALREALEDFKAGDRGVTIEEFDRAFRERSL